MPHVLWEMQGIPKVETEIVDDDEGRKQEIISGLTIDNKGSMTTEQFNNTVRDLVNFLHYLAEPSKQERLSLGKWVILYLVLFFIVMYLVKLEYWRDVAHKKPR